MDEPQTPRDDQEPAVRRKEKPPTRDNRDREREQNRPKTKERPRDRDHRARSRDRTFSGDRGEPRGRTLDREMDRNGNGHESRDRHRDGKRERHKSRDKHHSRDRSRERELDNYSLDPSRGCSEESLEWEEHKNRPRLPSGPNDVFEEPNPRGPSNDGQSPRERGMDRGPCVGILHCPLVLGILFSAASLVILGLFWFRRELSEIICVMGFLCTKCMALPS